MSTILRLINENFNAIHFVLCVGILYLLARSKRVNSKLVPSAPSSPFTPISLPVPSKQTYRQTLKKRKRDMTKIAYDQKKLRGKEYQREKKRINVVAPLLYWLEIAIAFFGAIIKDIEWFLREKLKYLPNAGAGVYINSLACLPLILSFRWLPEQISDNPNMEMYYSTEEIVSIADKIRLFLGLSSPLVIAGVLFLFFTFIKNREFYFDFYGIAILMYESIFKLFVCGYYQCCYGIPYEWGVYNEELKTIVFPVQYFEAITMFVGALICIIFILSKFYRPGRVVCLALAWFSVCRFISEFFRYTADDFRPNSMPEKFGLGMVHWVCIACFLFAVVMWFLLPLEKKILDWVSKKGRELWDIFKRRIQSNAVFSEFSTSLKNTISSTGNNI